MTIYFTHEFNSRIKGESHRLLERAIAIHIGDPKRASELVSSIHSCTELGKPTIDGFNDFSISHSRNTWAVLIADSQCGLDVQYTQNSNVAVIAKRYYTAEEYELVSSEGGVDEFFRIWARREALVKAAGTTIVNSNLPCVLGSRAEFEDVVWVIKDVDIPKADDSDKYYAAACTKLVEEVIYVEI